MTRGLLVQFLKQDNNGWGKCLFLITTTEELLSKALRPLTPAVLLELISGQQIRLWFFSVKHSHRNKEINVDTTFFLALSSAHFSTFRIGDRDQQS